MADTRALLTSHAGKKQREDDEMSSEQKRVITRTEYECPECGDVWPAGQGNGHRCKCPGGQWHWMMTSLGLRWVWEEIE